MEALKSKKAHCFHFNITLFTQLATISQYFRVFRKKKKKKNNGLEEVAKQAKKETQHPSEGVDDEEAEREHHKEDNRTAAQKAFDEIQEKRVGFE